MKHPGGTLKNRKTGKISLVDPHNIVRVNFLKREFEKYKALSILKHLTLDKQTLTIAADWFEVFLVLNPILFAEIPKDLKEGETYIQWTENIGLAKSTMGGHPQMKHCWDVVLMDNDEQKIIGWLWTHPNSTIGGIHENSAWFKMGNELLYQAGWFALFSAFITESLSEVNNISRLDIAVDGCNDLCVWLNFYTKQLKEKKKFVLMGKAQFHCGAQDHKTMLYESFRVGTSKSDKVLVVYNKSKEIQVSGKKYIQDFWVKNGLIATDPVEIVTERFKNFNPDFWGNVPVVYRCELRLKPKAIQEFEDFDITRLEEPDYLASIFLTSVYSTLRFALLTGKKKISEEKHFLPIDFSYLNGVLLDKSRKTNTDHRFKARMGIHAACAAIFTGKAQGKDAETLLDAIDYNLGAKDLSDWFAKKIEDFENKYLPFFPADGDRTAIAQLIHIRSQFVNQAPAHLETKAQPDETQNPQLDSVLDYWIEETEARKALENSLLLPDDDEPPF